MYIPMLYSIYQMCLRRISRRVLIYLAVTIEQAAESIGKKEEADEYWSESHEVKLMYKYLVAEITSSKVIKEQPKVSIF